MNAASLLLAKATVVARDFVYLPIRIVRTGSTVNTNVPTYLVLTLKIRLIRLTARPHLLWSNFVILGSGLAVVIKGNNGSDVVCPGWSFEGTRGSDDQGQNRVNC